mmetsp:Transcript_17382/g.60694  ORF Transcript_17382/g.60694 Transcript_17382/m.60694 type:complete len:201 (+) Transcript_17382:671-1273(+)
MLGSFEGGRAHAAAQRGAGGEAAGALSERPGVGHRLGEQGGTTRQCYLEGSFRRRQAVRVSPLASGHASAEPGWPLVDGEPRARRARGCVALQRRPRRAARGRAAAALRGRGHPAAVPDGRGAEEGQEADHGELRPGRGRRGRRSHAPPQQFFVLLGRPAIPGLPSGGRLQHPHAQVALLLPKGRKPTEVLIRKVAYGAS